MTAASPLGLITPRLAHGTLRSMLAFGIGFQAVGLAALARSQGVNLVIVAVGGERLLGYWSVANRLMQAPFWVFQALWRVSYPTMARLRAHGEDTRLTVERFARVTALVSGAMLAPLAASAHIVVPALFGANWAPAAAPLPWASAGLVVSGPISVAAAGYLYSEGDVRTPLVATVINGAVWVALTAILLRPVGIAAVGIAWMVASWTEAAIFARALVARRRSGQQNDHRAGCRSGRVRAVGVRRADAAVEPPPPRDRERHRRRRRIPGAQLRVQPCRSARHSSTSEVAHMNTDALRCEGTG